MVKIAIIGSAYVEIRGKDTFFERDIRSAVNKIKDVVLNVKADTDLSAVRKKIAAVKDDQRRRPLNLKADIDLTLVKAKLKSLRDRHAKDITIGVKADVAEATRNLSQLGSVSDRTVKLSVEADTKPAIDKLSEVHEKFKSSVATITAEANTVLARGELIDAARERTSGITANANTVRAEAQLAFAARNRTSNIKLGIDKDVQAGLKGLAYTLTGALPADKIKSAVTGIMANFESLVVSGAKISVMAGSVGASLLTLSANVLTLGAGVVETVGLLAMAPALLGAVGIGVTTLVLGFKGFGEALMGSGKGAAEALAKLPPLAQNAVVALKGLGSEIRVATQTKFWDALGTSMQDMVRDVFPDFKKGMEDSGTAVGGFVKEYFNVLADMNNNGGLQEFFANTSEGFDNAVRGIRPFNEALGILAVTGSTFLPRLGTWFSDLGTSFNGWIVEAEKAGDITRWIEEAINACQDLGDATVGITRIFQGLTSAARESGAKGLHEFAQGLLGIAETVQGDAFQSHLVEFFEGARVGSDALGEGLKNLATYIGEASSAWSAFFALTGEIGGSFLSSIKTMFDGTGLGSGLYEALVGAKKAVDILEPSFRDMGTILGDLGEIAAEVFVNMAPGLNQVLETIKGVVDGLKDGIIDAMPVFNAFLQAILNLASGPLIAIATGVGNLLSAFAGLDPVLQTVLLSLGAFLLLKAKFTPFFSNLGTLLNTAGTPLNTFRQNVRRTSDSIKTHAGNIATGFGLMGSAAGQMLKDIGRYSAGIGPSFRETGSAIAAPFRSGIDSMRLAMMGMNPNFAAFKNGMTAPFKEGFSDIARGYTGFVENAKWKMKDHAAVLNSHLTNAKNAFGSFRTSALLNGGVNSLIAKDAVSRTVSSIADGFKTLPSAVGNAIKSAPGVVGEVFKNTATNATNAIKGIPAAYGRMLDSVYKENLNASRGLSSLTQKFGPAVGEMHRYATAAYASATKSVSDGTVYARKHLADTGDAFRKAGASVNNAFVRPMSAEMSALGGVISSGIGPKLAGVRASFTSLGQDVGTAARAVSTGVATATSATGGFLRSLTSDATSGISRMVSSAGTHLNGLATAVGSSMGGVVERVRTDIGRVSSAFSPAVAAARNLGTNIATGVAGALPHLSSLRTAAGLTATAIGGGIGSAGRGVAGAVAGLSGALGGPWGIALMGATVAIGAFASAQAKTKAEIKGVADALDQQTGAFTTASQKKVAEDLLDQNATFIDDILRQGRNSEEIIRDLGLDSNQITKMVSNPDTRQGYEDAWKEIVNSIDYDIGRQDVVGDFNFDQLSDSALKMAGTTRDALKNMSAVEIQELERRIRLAGTTAAEAEKIVVDLAKATGTNTIQAAKLAANYDVLKSSTSSVSEKMSAFTSNLKIMSKGKMDSISTDKALKQSTEDYQTSLRDLLNVQNELGEVVDVVDFSSYVDAAGNIDMTTQSARDLHTTLQGAASGIHETAIAAFQASRDSGASMEVASAAAVNAIKAPVAGLRSMLESEFGFTSAQVDGFLDQLGLVDGKVVEALITADSQDAVNEILRVELLASGLNSGNWTMVLNALPDAAKTAITDVLGTAEDLKTGDWTATLKALDATKGGVGAALTELALVTDGDWTSEITAINQTNPAVAEAMAGFGTVLMAAPDVPINAWNNTQANVVDATNMLHGIQSPNVYINATDMTAVPVSSATAATNGINPPTVPISASDLTAGPVSTATSATNGINHPTVNIKASDLTGPAVWSAIRSAGSVPEAEDININAHDHATSILTAVANTNIPNKSFSIVGVLSGVSAKVRELLGMYDGGILNGSGVQKFANGGFSDAGVKAYARGGVEKHVAQITSRNTPIRIWSEPETGGEAYIPLNPAKRARSMKILEEVMRIFGVTAAQKFANGGFSDMSYTQATTPSLSYTSPAVIAAPTVSDGTRGGNFQVIVNPSQGLSETQIGQIAGKELYWQVMNRAM